MIKVYINGKLVPIHRAKISLFSRTLLFGEGLFETIRVHHGRAIFLIEHIQRLYGSCKYMGFKKIPSQAKTIQMVKECTLKAGIREGRLKLLLLVRDHFLGSVNTDPTGFDLVILVSTLSQKLKSVVRLKTVNLPFRSNLSFHKTFHYAEGAIYLRKARLMGYDDVLFIYQNKALLEATTANIFLIGKKTLYTPSSELPLLKGVTRKKIIQTAKQSGIKVVEAKISPKFISQCESAFLSSSIRGMVPIQSIDRKDFDLNAPLFNILSNSLLARIRQSSMATPPK